jgi:hypothetical protein
MIRISNAAKYSTTFTPSKTYGVVSDTKLFLGSTTPTVDGSGEHPINNQRVVVSTDFPITALLHLDAGNVASYPGSGTVWTDLVAGKEFTLYGGPAYNSANGGYLNFSPSSNQYAEATSFPDSLTTWTIEAWHYYDGTTPSNQSPCIVTEVYAGGGGINYTLGNCSDSSPNLQVGHFDGGGWNPTPQGHTLTSGNWYHLVGTFDGSAHRLYINGTLTAIQATTSPATRSGAGIRLMCRWDYPQFWGGRLAVVRIYGSAMNVDGVLSNYNSTKSRYGL